MQIGLVRTNPHSHWVALHLCLALGGAACSSLDQRSEDAATDARSVDARPDGDSSFREDAQPDSSFREDAQPDGPVAHDPGEVWMRAIDLQSSAFGTLPQNEVLFVLSDSSVLPNVWSAVSGQSWINVGRMTADQDNYASLFVPSGVSSRYRMLVSQDCDNPPPDDPWKDYLHVVGYEQDFLNRAPLTIAASDSDKCVKIEWQLNNEVNYSGYNGLAMDAALYEVPSIVRSGPTANDRFFDGKTTHSIEKSLLYDKRGFRVNIAADFGALMQVWIADKNGEHFRVSRHSVVTDAGIHSSNQLRGVKAVDGGPRLASVDANQMCGYQGSVNRTSHIWGFRVPLSKNGDGYTADPWWVPVHSDSVFVADEQGVIANYETSPYMLPGSFHFLDSKIASSTRVPIGTHVVEFGIDHSFRVHRPFDMDEGYTGGWPAGTSKGVFTYQQSYYASLQPDSSKFCTAPHECHAMEVHFVLVDLDNNEETVSWNSSEFRTQAGTGAKQSTIFPTNALILGGVRHAHDVSTV